MDTERCYGCMRRKTQHPVCEHCGHDERTQNQHNQLPIGTILHGQYEIGKVLGQGGFGITYMGWDTALDMPVAIKEFFPSGLVSRNTELASTVNMTYGSREDIFHQSRERFLREAKILGMLRDIPGIVRVYNLFTENNTAYIIMEFIQGIDLRMYLKKHGVMTVEQTLRILKPVITSLGKLHETNLVHRDISPDNIMMRPDGEAKLLDFGAVSIVANADAEKDLNHSTMAIMKKGFAPVEQYQTRGSLGPWTDVYAMCATIYYCLTGRVPPDALDRLADNAQIGWETIPGLTKRQVAALEKGMAIRPKDRIASMQELERALYGAAPQPAPKAAPKQPKPEKKAAPPKPKAEKKPAKKKPIGLIVAALLVVCIVGAVALLWKPSTEEPQLHTPETEAQTEEVTQPAQLSEEEIRYNEAAAWEADGQLGRAAIAFGKLGDYSDAKARSFAIWEKITPRETLQECYAIRKDGTAAVTSGAPSFAQNAVSQWTDLVEISSIGPLVLGLQSDGTLLSVTNPNGSNHYITEDCDVSGWTDIVDLSAGLYSYMYKTGFNGSWSTFHYGYVLGLKSDGTVVSTGDNRQGQCDVSDWTDIIAIAIDNYGEEYVEDAKWSAYYTVGLKYDGTVVTAGRIPKTWDLSGWTDIVKISTSGEHMAGLRSDGTVISTRYDVSRWKDITDIDAGSSHILGLRADGTVAATGNNDMYQHLNVDSWTDIVAISASDRHTVGLKADGTVVAVGYNNDRRCAVSDWTDIAAINAVGWNSQTTGWKSDGAVITTLSGPVFTDVRIPVKTLPARNGNETKQEETPDNSDNARAYAAAEELLRSGETAKAAIAFGKLGDYLDARERSFELWAEVAPRKTLDASSNGTVGIKEDGTVVISNTYISNDAEAKANWKQVQETVARWTDIVSVLSGPHTAMGLKSDGTIVTASGNTAIDWQNIVSVSGAAGLRADGTVVAFDSYEWGQEDVADWTDIVAISAGNAHIVGLKADGTVLSAGHNCCGQADFSGWTDVTAICASDHQTVGLRSDGTVLVSGHGDSRQLDAAKWTDIIAVSSGSQHTVGLRADGTVLAVGFNGSGECNVSEWTDIVAIDTGYQFTLGLKADGTVLITGNQKWSSSEAAQWTDIKLPN